MQSTMRCMNVTTRERSSYADGAVLVNEDIATASGLPHLVARKGAQRTQHGLHATAEAVSHPARYGCVSARGTIGARRRSAQLNVFALD